MLITALDLIVYMEDYKVVDIQEVRGDTAVGIRLRSKLCLLILCFYYLLYERKGKNSFKPYFIRQYEDILDDILKQNSLLKG